MLRSKVVAYPNPLLFPRLMNIFKGTRGYYYFFTISYCLLMGLSTIPLLFVERSSTIIAYTIPCYFWIILYLGRWIVCYLWCFSTKKEKGTALISGWCGASSRGLCFFVIKLWLIWCMAGKRYASLAILAPPIYKNTLILNDYG